MQASRPPSRSITTSMPCGTTQSQLSRSPEMNSRWSSSIGNNSTGASYSRSLQSPVSSPQSLVPGNNPIPAASLGLVEAFVGGGQHFGDAGTRHDAVEADANRHAQFPIDLPPVEQLDSLTDPFGQSNRRLR